MMEKERIAKLVEENWKLVPYTFHRYIRGHIFDRDEFLSEGFWGLFHAARTYDGRTNFPTYAIGCIYRQMIRIIRKWNTDKRSKMQTISLDKPVEFLEQKKPMYLSEILSDGTDFTERVEDQLLVRQLMKVLTQQEKQLIALHFGLDGHEPMSQREIGQMLGRSREWVRININQALKKMKRAYLRQGKNRKRRARRAS